MFTGSTPLSEILKSEYREPDGFHKVSLRSLGGQRILSQVCHAPQTTFRYCPALDLLALAASSTTVEAYRLNGEKVLQIKVSGLHDVSGTEPAITSLAWRADGMLLLDPVRSHGLECILPNKC